jgi:hypothetical protein
MVSTVSLNDGELIVWLNNFPNKSKIVKQALREYKWRHYDGKYFTLEEVKMDQAKYQKKYDKIVKKLEKINNLIKKMSEQDGENTSEN